MKHILRLSGWRGHDENDGVCMSCSCGWKTYFVFGVKIEDITEYAAEHLLSHERSQP